VSGYAGSLMAHSAAVALVTLALFIVLFALYTLRVRAGLHVPLRRISLYQQLPHLAERSTETGAPVVTWLASRAQDGAGPEIVAGITLYDYICRQAARADQPAPLRTNSPVALLLAMNALQSNRERNGFHRSYQPSELEFFGTSPTAFAGGVDLDPGPRPRSATLLAGTFEGEGLWLGTAMQDVDASALTVSGDPAGDALVTVACAAGSTVISRGGGYDTTGPLLPGEDLYAAGAYLEHPQALGSLLSEDAVRWLIIAVVLVAVLLTSLGYGG
jgi:hypothetical protein